jgi:hypothetical protein
LPPFWHYEFSLMTLFSCVCIFYFNLPVSNTMNIYSQNLIIKPVQWHSRWRTAITVLFLALYLFPCILLDFVYCTLTSYPYI